MANNDSIYLTIRLDIEYDDQYEPEDARVQAANRLTSFLSSANLYNKEGGLRIADVEVCDINEE